MASVLSRKSHKPILVNGVANHVHVLVGMHQSQSVAEMVRDVKATSSKHFKEMGWVAKDFAWQTGYAAFSVGKENLPQVYNYVVNQEQRHAGFSFREELVRMLESAGIHFEEQYLMDEIADDRG